MYGAGTMLLFGYRPSLGCGLATLKQAWSFSHLAPMVMLLMLLCVPEE